MLTYMGVAPPGHAASGVQGYGRDPDLLQPRRQPWPSQLNDADRRVISALVDSVLPPDDTHPAPSTLGLVVFFDEWLSAPYPDQGTDHAVLSPWIRRAVADGFTAMAPPGRTAWLQSQEANPEVRSAFRRFVELTAGAYYTAPQGASLAGFIGNQPSDHFAGPPADVVAKLEAAAALSRETGATA
jgi:hypothetical protein